MADENAKLCFALLCLTVVEDQIRYSFVYLLLIRFVKCLVTCNSCGYKKP